MMHGTGGAGAQSACSSGRHHVGDLPRPHDARQLQHLLQQRAVAGLLPHHLARHLRAHHKSRKCDRKRTPRRRLRAPPNPAHEQEPPPRGSRACARTEQMRRRCGCTLQSLAGLVACCGKAPASDVAEHCGRVAAGEPA